MSADLLTLRAFGFGALCWLVPFLGAFPLFPLKEKRPNVFKALMALVLAGATVAVCRWYFADRHPTTALEGVTLGALWMGICLAIDLPLFVKGFKMTPRAYLSEIGVAYLVIPLLTWEHASLLAGALERSS